MTQGPLVSVGWSAIRVAANPKWLAIKDLRLPKGTSEARTMAGIHAFALKKIRYKRELLGQDVWQKPADTMALGTGDCEDIGIVERALAINAGYRDIDIELMIVHDLQAHQAHSLLWIKEHYLDIFTNQVLHVSQFRPDRDYRPIAGHRASESFIYGRIVK